MTFSWAVVGIVAVAGLLIGVTIRNAARRRGSTPVEAARNQNMAISIAILVGAAILGWVTATETHPRVVNVMVTVLMVVVAVSQLAKLKRGSRT